MTFQKSSKDRHRVTYLTPPLWRDLVKILTRKLRHSSSLSLECTDFKNVIFEIIPEPSLRSLRSPRANDLKTQNDENSKWKLVKTRWNPKFGLSDLENDLLTSMTSKGAQWKFRKLQFLNQCIKLRKMIYTSSF